MRLFDVAFPRKEDGEKEHRGAEAVRKVEIVGVTTFWSTPKACTRAGARDGVRYETSRGSGSRVVQKVSCCVLCFVFLCSRGEGRCHRARPWVYNGQTGVAKKLCATIVCRLNASMNKQN